MKNKIIKYCGATLLCCLCVVVVTGSNLTELNNRAAKLKADFFKQLEYKPDLHNDTSLNEHSRNLTELNKSIAKLREEYDVELKNDIYNLDLNISSNDIKSYVKTLFPTTHRFSVRKVLIGILVVIKLILLIIRLCVYFGNKDDDHNDTANKHDNVPFCTIPLFFVLLSLSVAISIILIL